MMMMMMHSKRLLLVFIVGLTFGFVLTHVSMVLMYGGHRHTGAHVDSQHRLVPLAPHAHSDDDDDDGHPVHEVQEWKDFHEHSHIDSDASQALSRRVRILCWVMTSPKTIDSKARHVKATWGRRCNVLVFVSSQPDRSLPAVGLNISEGRDFLWGKTRAAFAYVHKHYRQAADWFMKADDDTYVVIENLRMLLKDHSPDEPIYFGRKFRPYVRQGYMSGGAGYVLSREAVDRLVRQGLTDSRRCRQDPGGAEDVELGQCMASLGVVAGDSRDEAGRDRFHPFTPELHLIPGSVPRDNWYWQYNYYPTREGPACCSDSSISFHYVSPDFMYVFEYFIYHLRPYDVRTTLHTTPYNTSLLPPSALPVAAAAPATS